MLVQGPLCLQIGHLDLDHTQLRLRLSHIKTRRDSASLAIRGQLERSLVGAHGATQKTRLDINVADPDEVLGQHGLQAQTSILQVGRRGLARGLARGNRIAYPAPEVNLVGECQGRRVGTVVGRLRHQVVTEGAIIRLSVSGHRGGSIDGGYIRCAQL